MILLVLGKCMYSFMPILHNYNSSRSNVRSDVPCFNNTESGLGFTGISRLGEGPSSSL